MQNTSDLRIATIHKLTPPDKLKIDIPMTEKANETVVSARTEIKQILNKTDSRPMIIVGPCSIHDPKAAVEYAERLLKLREKVNDKIMLIMRVYFEKPRTRIGWKGLVFDPYLDGTNEIDDGLRIARELLVKINEMGMPAGSEILDHIVPQYIADLISWAAIGARTTESQTHRNMASGLSMPVGFKNGTDGNLEVAIDALAASKHPHSFIGIDPQGATCILHTTGNEDAHLILRGGKFGPNYYEENVEQAVKLLDEAEINSAIVIDCSHANSGKKHIRQERVFQSFIDQKTRGQVTLVGTMLESNLKEGNQKIKLPVSEMEYGVSVTDECIGWDKTEEIIMDAFNRL